MESCWGQGIVLFALLVAPFHGVASSSSPAPVPVIDAKRFDVKISSASQRSQLSSLANPDVLAVEEALEAVLGKSMDADMIPLMVEDELEQAYPGSVQIRSAVTKYTWIWVEHLMEWVPVCCNLTTFDVSLGTIVQVDVEVVTKLGPP